MEDSDLNDLPICLTKPRNYRDMDQNHAADTISWTESRFTCLTICRQGWVNSFRNSRYVLNPHWDDDLFLFGFGKAETY